MFVRVMIRCAGAARAGRRNSRGALGVEHPYPHPHRRGGHRGSAWGAKIASAPALWELDSLCEERSFAAQVTRSSTGKAHQHRRRVALFLGSHRASTASCRAPTHSPRPNHLPLHPHTPPTSGWREELSRGTHRNPGGGNALAPTLTLVWGDARAPRANFAVSHAPPLTSPPLPPG